LLGFPLRLILFGSSRILYGGLPELRFFLRRIVYRGSFDRLVRLLLLRGGSLKRFLRCPCGGLRLRSGALPDLLLPDMRPDAGLQIAQHIQMALQRETVPPNLLGQAG
jgi:hypothetical protein